MNQASESQETLSEGASLIDNDDSPPKFQGAFRRNSPLLLGVLLVAVSGPSLTRLIENYRGVVLEYRDDQMLVGLREPAPPKWVAAIEVELGSIVLKEGGDWTSRVVPTAPTDHQLIRLHRRYNSTYEGTIVRIREPRVHAGPHVAIVECGDGKKRMVELWGMHLASAQVGSRVEKRMHSWEPVLTDVDAELLE
jgi:hypothetical protein